MSDDMPAERQPVSAAVLLPPAVIRTYDAKQWEEFVLEWIEGFDPPYIHFDRIGGAGDLGRDIVAYLGQPNTDCHLDVYQCKHYDHPLRPNEVWVELGKLVHYTHQNAYRTPRRYRLVAPQGVGGSLGDLLTQPVALRAGLIENWAAKCERQISTTPVPLDQTLRQYIESFDFSIVGYIPVNQLLTQHRKTRHWHTRFKRDYPNRPAADTPPSQVTQPELEYVARLCAAYADHLNGDAVSVADLVAHTVLAQHFERARTDFFMADGLNRFYRDQFPGGAFDHVKRQVYDGIVETADGTYPDGLERVRAVVQQAAQLTLSQTDYTPYVEPGDKKGVCHHLANDGKLTWVKK